MFSPPADPHRTRLMRQVFDRSAVALRVRPDGGHVWGWYGRTLSGRVRAPGRRPAWLRVTSTPEHHGVRRLHDGNTAARIFDGRVPKPALLQVWEHTHERGTFRAELSQYVTEPPLSGGPVLRHEPPLPASWWGALRMALETVAGTPTDREVLRQEWVDRAVPELLGVPAPRVTEWSTAHGDLHPGNLTSRGPLLLDWEGFGRAPRGYDAATLLASSLTVPGFARRVRATFPVLRTEAGRVAQLIVIAELLETAPPGDYPDAITALRTLAAHLTRASRGHPR
ncbi:hypothetical protein E0L36_15380 [Streptomyces sp. AJS327]|uniref:phosphotransferase family protein n=1 Tax=Streptomyces sp. AJS327 TaxID=2545265 RepID=UPI0015DECE23|nr:phosphotransferase [Streptomyces sp. AJS327]MBA0052235.1 hypothetical protein [Streptomyces sp. AJS327]